MIQEIASPAQIEKELKKRLNYPYHWGRVQNNADDRLTNFVYSVLYFEDLLTEIKKRLGERNDYDPMFNYALNRWYNFWSAMAVEKTFGESPLVKMIREPGHPFADFEIKGIRFDHKTSVYPKNYPFPLESAIDHPQDLLTWLYVHQSKENRMHFKNRIFIILYAADGEHWKLKAEISYLKELILLYLQQFDYYKLFKICLDTSLVVLSDVIWAIKQDDS